MEDTPPTNANPPVCSNDLLADLNELRRAGLPCRAHVVALIRLGLMPPVGHRILKVALKVLKEPIEKKRYGHMLDLLSVERSILEPIFPDAPKTTPLHMQDAPEWVTASPIEG